MVLAILALPNDRPKYWFELSGIYSSQTGLDRQLRSILTGIMSSIGDRSRQKTLHFQAEPSLPRDPPARSNP
jgi:hypothetical protein